MEQGTSFAVPVGQRQLFLDDYGIASISGLLRTMHPPAKKGAVIRPNLDRGETALQTRSAPAWDPEANVFKLWLITSSTFHSGTTYVESEDGLHWRKPALGQQQVNGSSNNNFVTVDPQLEWPANAMENVLRDADDPDPSRRYKALGHCYGREPLVSPDGIHWRRLEVPPIPSSDESNLSYDPYTHTFIATLKDAGGGGRYGRSAWLSTSADFQRWTEPRLLFEADDLDQQLGRGNIEARLADPTRQPLAYDDPARYSVQVYNMGLFRYEGLYIGLPTMYHETGQAPDDHGGFHQVQLVCSRDLRHWERLGERRPFLDSSPLGAGAYDLTCIIGPSWPVVRGEELCFYYTGLKYYGGEVDERFTRPEFNVLPRDPDKGAICLAVLRRDGFISLDAGDRPGTLLTQPFRLTGKTLFVNVDAAKGALRAEVLDAAGDVVAASEPLEGERTRAQVEWRQGDLADLQGEQVSLRFTLRNAHFYSYWLEP